MRKIAVLEWIRGGGLAGEAEEAIPSSLLREGTAMLDAVVRLLVTAGANVECCVDSRWGTGDLLQSEHVQYTLVHARPDQQVELISAHAVCPEQWLQVAARCDYGLLVAPELGGILGRTARQLRDAGIRLLNCEPPLLEVASDKWQCFERWSAHGLCTPATTLLSELDDTWMQAASAILGDSANAKWVLKPRDGAGSEGLLPIQATSAAELRQAVEQISGDSSDGHFIVQPLMPGRAFSRCVVVDREGDRRWMPLMTQELSPDFKYLGGKVVRNDRSSNVAFCTGRGKESRDFGHAAPSPTREAASSNTLEMMRSYLTSRPQPHSSQPQSSQPLDSLSHETWNEMVEVIADALAGGETAGNLRTGPRTRRPEAGCGLAVSPAAIQLDVASPSDSWCNALLDALGSGALGWLGLDLLLSPAGSWIAIECNPRCTTSIVQLAGIHSSNPG